MDAAAVLLVLWLLPATGAALYYFALTFFGRATPRHSPAATPGLHLTVLIPAYDEEHTLPVAIRAAFASDYPEHLRRVVVVADSRTDGTAAVARRLGAACVERADDSRRGKGFALAFGFRHVLRTATDAVVVVDADCEFAPQSLRRLAAALEAGAQAAQAAVLTRNPCMQPAGLVAGVGGQLENAGAAGLGRLGVAAGLRGTGKAFRRGVIEAHPRDAFGLTEDAEYAGRPRRAGVGVRFVLNAEVFGEAPPTANAFGVRRRRWRSALSASGRGPARALSGSKPLVLAQLALTVAGAAAAWHWLRPPLWPAAAA